MSNSKTGVNSLLAISINTELENHAIGNEDKKQGRCKDRSLEESCINMKGPRNVSVQHEFFITRFVKKDWSNSKKCIRTQ